MGHEHCSVVLHIERKDVEWAIVFKAMVTRTTRHHEVARPFLDAAWIDLRRDQASAEAEDRQSRLAICPTSHAVGMGPIISEFREKPQLTSCLSPRVI